ncbi:MAG: 30S ribosomal protein S8 [Parachlamydiales bacterium]
MTDPIADLLTRIRNGSRARRRYVEMSSSKIRVEIIKLLQQNGFIQGFLAKGEHGMGVIRVYLKYSKTAEPVIHGLKRVSKPSVRRYVGYREIPRVLGGMGIAMLSTPKGIMTGRQAREEKIGGELLCHVW